VVRAGAPVLAVEKMRSSVLFQYSISRIIEDHLTFKIYLTIKNYHTF
jgi:hypothetical protein